MEENKEEYKKNKKSEYNQKYRTNQKLIQEFKDENEKLKKETEKLQLGQSNFFLANQQVQHMEVPPAHQQPVQQPVVPTVHQPVAQDGGQPVVSQVVNTPMTSMLKTTAIQILGFTIPILVKPLLTQVLTLMNPKQTTPIPTPQQMMEVMQKVQQSQHSPLSQSNTQSIPTLSLETLRNQV